MATARCDYMFDCLVIHYGEIGTKGDNRVYFERTLINNLSNVLGKQVLKVYRRYGKIVCDLASNFDRKVIIDKLELLPGVSSFAFSVRACLDLEDINDKTDTLLSCMKFNTFKVVASRSNKSFKYNSQDLNKLVGGQVVDKFKKVADMTAPEIKVFIEIGEKDAFIYTDKDKYLGIGGLPVGVSGKIVCSLSGGIDSPVASYLMMKRGCEVLFVHIYSNTLANNQLKEKIYKLVNQLSKYQLSSKLYMVPFSDIQRKLIGCVTSDYRMIIYRRFMMKIINRIAKIENAKAITTGDSVGQVASQTLENISCIYDSSDIPVLPPLIGMSKDEIIGVAKKIGTYDYSILPYPDCCSFMIAQHPETRAELKDILNIEKAIDDIDELIKDCVAKAEIIKGSRQV